MTLTTQNIHFRVLIKLCKKCSSDIDVAKYSFFHSYVMSVQVAMTLQKIHFTFSDLISAVLQLKIFTAVPLGLL